MLLESNSKMVPKRVQNLIKELGSFFNQKVRNSMQCFFTQVKIQKQKVLMNSLVVWRLNNQLRSQELSTKREHSLYSGVIKLSETIFLNQKRRVNRGFVCVKEYANEGLEERRRRFKKRVITIILEFLMEKFEGQKRHAFAKVKKQEAKLFQKKTISERIIEEEMVSSRKISFPKNVHSSSQHLLNKVAFLVSRRKLAFFICFFDSFCKKGSSPRKDWSLNEVIEKNVQIHKRIVFNKRKCQQLGERVEEKNSLGKQSFLLIQEVNLKLFSSLCATILQRNLYEGFRRMVFSRRRER